MSDSATLAELLRATSGGNRDAFRQLYGAVSAKLFGVALRILQRRELAEEVLQEVFVRIWAHAAEYQSAKGSPMTWMIAITRNQALDVRRRGRDRVRGGEGDLLEQVPASTPNPLDWTLASSESRTLERCLGELSEAQRDCIVMAYVEGYTQQELAARMDRPLGTIKSWVRRGLLQLKECLER